MKTLKIVLVIGLIFAAGFVAGVVTTRVVVRHFVQRALANPDLLTERIARDLNRSLRLDAEQRVKVEQILTAAHSRIKTLRLQVQPQLIGVVHDAKADIKEVLRPDQQARFDEYCARRAAFLPDKPTE